MPVIEHLEYQLNKQWKALSSIKSQTEYQQARAEALKLYQTLKKQKQLMGLL